MTAGARTSVLLVDDDVELLSSLTVLTDRSELLELVGSATDARKARAICASRRPGVVLADVRMAGTDGISLTRTLTGGERLGRPRVLVTTAFPLDEYLLAALGAGASGFLPKGVPWPELERALVTVDQGGIALPEQLSTHLVDLVLPARVDLSGLSSRELDVLALVGSGASLPLIAQALVLSEGTVRAHLEHLRTKLGAHNRVELALLARRAGLGYLEAPQASPPG